MARDAAVTSVLVVSGETLIASAVSNLLTADPLLHVSRLLVSGGGWDEVVRESVRMRPAALVLVAADAEGMTVVVRRLVQEGLRVVVMAASTRYPATAAAFRSGASAVLGGDVDPDELRRAVHEVVAGHPFVSRGVLRGAVSHVQGDAEEERADGWRDVLAPREREIVRLLVRGCSNREIAASLHLSEATVKVHLGRVMEKWMVRDRLQVALRALGVDGGVRR